jgi:CubicO group peptidase (beta-lactamase class C family)
MNCTRLTIAAALISFVTAIYATAAAAERPPLATGDWERHGFTTEQRDQIRAGFQQAINAKAIPGASLLLIHKGEVILREGYGVADFETKRPFSPDAPCRIASVTKPHTATVLVMLAAQGKLSLDDPIDKWLPEFKGIKVRGHGPARHAPTLSECLSHTAGFPANSAVKSGGEDVQRDGTLAEVVSNLAKQELVAEPGARYAYTGLGFMTAGRVVEVVTGKDFAAVMDELLLEPIGATQTTFFPSKEMSATMPTFYERDARGIRIRTGERPGKAINPGGGLVSTLDDVGRLLMLHRNQGKLEDRQIVPGQWLQKMYIPQPGTGRDGYGLGFNILKRRPDGTARRIQHIGASGTLALLDFDADLALVIFTQVGGGRNKWRADVVQTIASIFGQ